MKARISGPASSSIVAASPKRPSSCATTRTCCSRTDSASGLGEDRATIVATKPCAALGTRVKKVAHEVGGAALPGGAGQRRLNRVDQAGVDVRGHQLDPGQPATAECQGPGSRPARFRARASETTSPRTTGVEPVSSSASQLRTHSVHVCEARRGRLTDPTRLRCCGRRRNREPGRMESAGCLAVSYELASAAASAMALANSSGVRSPVVSAWVLWKYASRTETGTTVSVTGASSPAEDASSTISA